MSNKIIVTKKQREAEKRRKKLEKQMKKQERIQEKLLEEKQDELSSNDQPVEKVTESEA